MFQILSWLPYMLIPAIADPFDQVFLCPLPSNDPFAFNPFHFPFELSLLFDWQRSYISRIVPIFLEMDNADNIVDLGPGWQCDFVCQ
jgi:hypothetical protein